MESLAAEEAEKEAERLRKKKTRATKSVNHDDSFRKKTTAAFLMAGVPLNKLDKLRAYLESETAKSLGPTSHLAQKYAKPLLDEEVKLQKAELKYLKHCSTIFDSTPHGKGDFFAQLVRFVEEQPLNKRAKAIQRLTHVSALKSSFTADTLVGELTKGLGNRGLSHESAVAAINDGCCFTNGAAHNILAQAANAGDNLTRFICLCISHCASNAGKQAGFPILNLFWTVLQKVMSHSSPAKVSDLFLCISMYYHYSLFSLGCLEGYYRVHLERVQ